MITVAVWGDNRNGPRERARAETLSQGLGGGVHPGFAGPGRFYAPRDPLLARQLDPKDCPGSAMVDAALAGDQPAIQRQPDQPAAAIVPGQLYPGPRRADIRRDRGTAQLATAGGTGTPTQQHRGTAASMPVEPAAERELPTEKNPPHKTGYRVVRDPGGGAQTVPVHGDRRTVADYLGSQYFNDGEPSPSAGPVCANDQCSKALTPGPAGSDKRFCSASCRALAWRAQKLAAASAN